MDTHNGLLRRAWRHPRAMLRHARDVALHGGRYDLSRRMVFLEHGSYICPERKVLWLLNPKVGSRTMYAILREHLGRGCFLMELPAEERNRRLIDNFDRYHSFIFVRHPATRVMSFYFDKIYNFRETEAQIRIMKLFPGLKPFMKIEAFFDWLATDASADATADPHFKSQWCFAMTRDGCFLPKHVYKIEQGDEAFVEAVRPLGIAITSVPRKNSNSDGTHRPTPVSNDYRRCCTPRIMEIIRRRYARDFELFSYDLDSMGS